MKFEKFVKGGLAAAMCFTLTACESSDTGSDSSSGTTTSDYTGTGDLDSFVIGAMGPTTGSTAVYGLATTNATVLAVEDYNEANGTDITVVVEDTTGDSATAVNVYNKFTTETGVAAIIGATLSGETYAIATASSDTGVPILTPSGTAQNITSETGDNIFRACYTDPQQAEQMAEFAYETLGVTTVAIIYNQDDEYSTGLTESFTEKFESLGGTIVASESYNTGDADFSTQLTTIAAESPEALFVPNYYNDDFQIAKQARDLGISATLLGCDGWDGVLSVAGDNADVLEGAIFINQYSPDMDSVQEIMAAYEEKFGTEINSFGINSYDATMLMIEAIRSCGSLKASDIVEELKSTEYEGILGTISFDENGDPIKSPIYVTVENGEYVTYEAE